MRNGNEYDIGEDGAMTMNDYLSKYNQWLKAPYIDQQTKAELAAANDPADIADRFYKDLELGTGGLRGVMGAGTNRVNKYTVRKASYGLAHYLLAVYGDQGREKGIVIAYDSRYNSDLFAREAAKVFCAAGIKTFLFGRIQPTPVLSFAVRYLGCIGGVVITASHNSKEYNGYKVYNHHGCQLVPKEADEVITHVRQVEEIAAIPVLDEAAARDQGLLTSVDEAVFEAYLQAVHAQSLFSDTRVKADLRIVFTPLHGTGLVPVNTILARDGFAQVFVVEEQKDPDGGFPTVETPNPEEEEALALGVAKARAVEADIVLGTDPDCDRVGVAVKHGRDYVHLTGNQLGALLAGFVLEQKKQALTPKSTLIKTIVTNDLGAQIAKSYGLQVVDTLTGFKFIGEKITEFERTGSNQFVMGYEESYGYLVGTHARDKDAVVASLLICEMAAHCLQQGKTLVDVLDELYLEYGCYVDHLDSFVFQGIDGIAQIERIMQRLRREGEAVLPDVIQAIDYKQGVGDLPRSDVLKFIQQDGSWIAVRPSGTEPKLKVYYSIRQPDKKSAQAKLDSIRGIMISRVVGVEPQ